MVLGDTTFRNLIPDVSLEDCLPKRKSVWGHRGDFFFLSYRASKRPSNRFEPGLQVEASQSP